MDGSVFQHSENIGHISERVGKKTLDAPTKFEEEATHSAVGIHDDGGMPRMNVGVWHANVHRRSTANRTTRMGGRRKHEKARSVLMHCKKFNQNWGNNKSKK